MKDRTRVAIWDIALYTSVITSVELAKEWNLIGSAGLRQYDVFDWIVLAVGVWAVAGVTVHAYFNNRFGKQLNNETAPPFVPPRP